MAWQLKTEKKIFILSFYMSCMCIKWMYIYRIKALFLENSMMYRRCLIYYQVHPNPCSISHSPFKLKVEFVEIKEKFDKSEIQVLTGKKAKSWLVQQGKRVVRQVYKGNKRSLSSLTCTTGPKEKKGLSGLVFSGLVRTGQNANNSWNE